MLRFLRYSIPALAMVFLLPVTANASSGVVASILPVHSLVAGVMQGVGAPQLLVTGAASPHDFALTPSAARALQSASAVFWIGAGLETFLVKPLAALSQDAAVVSLSTHVPLLEGREGGSWEAHDEADHKHSDHKEADHKHTEHKHADHKHADHKDSEHKETGHKHDSHSEGEGGHHGHEGHHDHDHAKDLHVWLDPVTAQAMVRVIVATLQKADPANGAAYAAKGEALVQRLETLDADLRDTLAPVRAIPYIVFHDAYQYFERRYGMNAVGSLTISPERSPGVKRLYAIREKIHATGARCVFAEPQFAPALVTTVLDGTQAKAGILDPVGAETPPGPDAYFTLLENLATELRTCLGNPG